MQRVDAGEVMVEGGSVTAGRLKFENDIKERVGHCYPTLTADQAKPGMNARGSRVTTDCNTTKQEC